MKATQPTCPVPTERNTNNEAFTFVEVILALTMACIIVTATTSAMLNVLRMDEAGGVQLEASGAVQSTLCHHLIPATRRPPSPPASTSETMTVNQTSPNKTWTIYTLTPIDDSDSITIRLALHR